MPDYVYEAVTIGKRYGGQVALDDVNFRVVRGAVNVLIGENGAGKSTLTRILAGVESADTGELRLHGEPIRLRSPQDASSHGIGIVHQELALLPNLDVTENIFAGRELVRSMNARSANTLTGVSREPNALGWIDRPAEERRSSLALAQLRQPVGMATPVAELSLGRQQIVELARLTTHGAQILILDEPTSALSSAEAEALFAVLAQLKQQGVSIVYISHRLHELLHLGDYFTVLRGGRVVGEAARGEIDRVWIVEKMSGRSVGLPTPHTPRIGTSPERLRVHAGACDFAVHSGEIVGVYGLLGSGRTELLEAIAGARDFVGELHVDGRRVHLRGVAEAIHAGVMLVPEDRQRDGLVPDLSIRENVMLGVGGALLSPSEETRRVRALATELNLKAPDLELPVTSLSGGNQQKVLLARCLLRDPKVLLLDEPTRGVDVGAKAEIYATLRRLAERGIAVLFTSSEIEETRALADRVLVLREGVVAAEFALDGLTDEALFAAASPVAAATGRAA